MKSYTDLEQSKKLAKILPLESADMWHHGFFTPRHVCKIEYNPPAPYHSVTPQWDCPCWSLAALLGVLPPYLYEWEKGIDFNLYPCVAKKRWCAGYISQDLSPENKDKFTLITHADNPVDACYEIILKLHELNLL